MDTNIETTGEDFVFTDEELRELDKIWGDAARPEPAWKKFARGEGPISDGTDIFDFTDDWDNWDRAA